MMPSFRKAGNPASRTSAFAVLLLCTSALAGCATANSRRRSPMTTRRAGGAERRSAEARAESSSCRNLCRFPAS